MKRKVIACILIAACLLTVPASAVYMIDVDEGSWAYPYASYMADYDIMPLDYGFFYPNFATTRGEFVLYLWRAAGSPEVAVKSPTFDDVSIYDDFFTAVEWALRNEITTGTSSTEFSPYLTLTREQAFTFLYRALPIFNYDTGGLTGRYINGFTDASTVDSWAWEAMNALCALGIVNGENGYLMPLRDVANAETAAILYRTLELAGALSTEAPDYFAEFAIYNETDNRIYAVNVMPTYSDGEGVDILPYILDAGDAYYAEITGSFIYTDSDDWKIWITDTEGRTSVNYQSFRPEELIYLDILWDSGRGGYYCEFVY